MSSYKLNHLTLDDRISIKKALTQKKLNNQSAYQLFSFLYGEEIADKLEMKAIPANEIILKPELVK